MNTRERREGVEQPFRSRHVEEMMTQSLSTRYGEVLAPARLPQGLTPAILATTAQDDEAKKNENGEMASSSGGGSISSPPKPSTIAYGIRPMSRTALTLPSQFFGAVDGQTKTTKSEEQTRAENQKVSFLDHQVAAGLAVAEELLRHEAFRSLMEVELQRLCQNGAASESSFSSGSIGTRQELHELPARWALQSLADMDQLRLEDPTQWEFRSQVTPLDVGATVRQCSHGIRKEEGGAAKPEGETVQPQHRHCLQVKRAASGVEGPPFHSARLESSGEFCSSREERRGGSGGASHEAPLQLDNSRPLYKIIATAPMSRGAYWVDIAPVYSTTTPPPAPPSIERVDHAAVELSPWKRLYVDPLLPCDELTSIRGVSTCLYLFLCHGLQRALDNRLPLQSMRPLLAPPEASEVFKRAAALAIEVSRLSFECRQRLAEQLQQLRTSFCAAVPTPYPGQEAPPAAVLRVRCDVSRRCLQLQGVLQFLPAPLGQSTTALHRVGLGEGAVPETAEATRMSPVVEVVLRSARKLGRLYDIAQGRSAVKLCDATAGSAAVEQVVRHATSHPSEWLSVSLLGGSSAITHAEWPASRVAFLSRLFVMLLRYRTLFGEKGYNQGPHAAVPPPIMEQLSHVFHLQAEAFASPLNTQLPQYGSLFPDTDGWFGSLGSFFDLQLGHHHDRLWRAARADTNDADEAGEMAKGHCQMEVNPPFDTAVLRHLERHLLSCLEANATSSRRLLFVVVLPSHDLSDAEAAQQQREGGGLRRCGAAPAGGPAAVEKGRGAPAAASTERRLRESSFCLGHVLCDAAESAYVDGHQHLLHSPLFRIATPTRLIVLGNAAAQLRYTNAAALLEEIRLSWKSLTKAATLHQKE